MKIDVKYSLDEQKNADELIAAIQRIFPLAKINHGKGEKNLKLYITLDYRWRNCLK